MGVAIAIIIVVKFGELGELAILAAKMCVIIDVGVVIIAKFDPAKLTKMTRSSNIIPCQ